MAIEIDHLGIAVRSIAEGLAFYERTLGMRVAHRETIAAERVNVAMLRAGDGDASPRIELLEASTPDSVIGAFVEKWGPGVHHIALKVDDLAASVARLEADGLQILAEPRIGAGGHQYVFVHPKSTGGVLLELIQR
jgi:methylmalonyl-CoA epimerase